MYKTYCTVVYTLSIKGMYTCIFIYFYLKHLFATYQGTSFWKWNQLDLHTFGEVERCKIGHKTVPDVRPPKQCDLFISTELGKETVGTS